MKDGARRLTAGEFIGRIQARASFDCADIAFIGDVPDVEPHEHDEDHVVLLLEGAYATAARGADEGVARGNAAIFNPAGTRHRDAFVRPGLLMTLTPRRTDARFKGGPRIGGAPAQARLCEIAREARQRDALSELVVASSCLELFAAAPCEGRPPPPWLARARAWLDEACEQEVSLATLARECGVHPVYFARAFRAHLGETPGAYQRRRRALRAAALLARSKKPIAEIALACGFADQAAFSKSFARVARQTPGAFRRSVQV